MTRVGYWIEDPQNFALVSGNYPSHSVTICEMGRPIIGTKNMLLLGLARSKQTDLYSFRTLNLSSDQKSYALHFDPESLSAMWGAGDSADAELALVRTEHVDRDNSLVRFFLPQTSEGRPKMYLRHSNYQLFFEEDDGLPQFYLDSCWRLRFADLAKETKSAHDFVSFPGIVFVRKVMGKMHEQVIPMLLSEALWKFAPGRMCSRSELAPVFDLQGAGGMAPVGRLAVRGADYISPLFTRGERQYPKELKLKVEGARRINELGGVAKFGRLTCKETEDAVIDLLAAITRTLSKSNYVRGNNKTRAFELGFFEFIHQPNSTFVTPHKDGPYDCDFAANVALHGSAIVTVDDPLGPKSFRLSPGDMYIFQPHKQEHSVAAPFDDQGQGRFIVSFRFFYIN